MKVSILLLALFLHCVNLEELDKVQPINYLYSVVIANLRGSQSGSSNQATFQIQGTLRDSSGNPIANATLSLGVSQNLVSREAVTTSTTTDSNGNYTLNLRVGNFSVKVTDSSGVEIGAFRLNATSTTEKPSIAVTSGNMSLVVSAVTSPAPISPIVAPTNLSYPSSVLNLTVGTPMTALTPSVTGTVSSYSVSPSLPTGLVLNSSSGIISGTPVSTLSTSNYTITARNSGGFSTYTITITTSNSQSNVTPPSNLSYTTSYLNVNVGSSVTLIPIVSGVVSSYSINPTTLPNGLNFNTNSGLLSGTPSTVSSISTYTISAKNSGGSSEFILQITVNPSAPSSLSYSVNPLILSIGSSMTEAKPTIIGTVDSFSISGNPSTLPSGLSLDSKTGIITGTPTSTQALTSYTISANNAGGSKSFVLQIKVIPLPPSSFSYSTNSLTLTTYTSMSPINPITSGTVDSYTLISPSSLPNGLSLDTRTGVISGTPTKAQSNISYTLSANNEGGSRTFVLQIIIDENPIIIRKWATFTDMMDGTIKIEINSGTFGGQYYYSRTVYFAKCTYGQNYELTSNTCSGNGTQLQFCSTNDNSCNQGDPTKLVSSGDLFKACDSLNEKYELLGNRNNWRVPTKNELKLLINCSDLNDIPLDLNQCNSYVSPTINYLFPNTEGYHYWTSDTFPQFTNNAWGIYFGNGATDRYGKTQKSIYVRCVSSQ